MMTKLDEAVRNIYGTFDWLGSLNDRAVVLKAAESYAALQKLAPEIGKLVEAGEKATHEFEKYPELTADILYLYRNGKGFNLMWWGKFLANINAALTKAANARPALKAIHDNLTTFRKEFEDV